MAVRLSQRKYTRQNPQKIRLFLWLTDLVEYHIIMVLTNKEVTTNDKRTISTRKDQINTLP